MAAPTVTSAKELMGHAGALFKQVRETLGNPDCTAEDAEKAYRMLEDAKALKARAMALAELENSKELVLPHIDEKNVPEGGRALPAGDLSWADFLIEAWKAGNPTNRQPIHKSLVAWKNVWDEDPDNQKREAKDLSGQSGAAGGFLIPAEFQATLMQVLGERGIVRSRATIIRMRRRQIDIPVLDQTSTTAGQPHWFGGMQFYWAEEASEKEQSDPKFKQISLVAHKMIGYTRASDELLDDSAISLADFLSGPLGMSGGIGWMEDYAFLRGTGAGQPLGILNAGATIVEPRAAAGAIGFDDICDMMEDFLPGARGTWVITQSALSEILQMNGPAGNASYIWIPNARDGMPGTLMGYPVIWSEKLPRIGNQGDILLADFAYYLVGDRQATTVESTQYDRWRYDQTSWRAVHRVDGQPWLSAPLTLQDGTSQVSPFVILGAAQGS